MPSPDAADTVSGPSAGSPCGRDEQMVERPPDPRAVKTSRPFGRLRVPGMSFARVRDTLVVAQRSVALPRPPACRGYGCGKMTARAGAPGLSHGVQRFRGRTIAGSILVVTELHGRCIGTYSSAKTSSEAIVEVMRAPACGPATIRDPLCAGDRAVVMGAPRTASGTSSLRPRKRPHRRPGNERRTQAATSPRPRCSSRISGLRPGRGGRTAEDGRGASSSRRQPHPGRRPARLTISPVSAGRSPTDGATPQWNVATRALGVALKTVGPHSSTSDAKTDGLVMTDSATPTASGRLPSATFHGLRPGTALLRLETTRSREGSLDGAWWPRTRDIAAELPALVGALTEHLGPIARVGLDAEAWESLPTRLVIDDRVVHIDSFPIGDDTVLITRGERDHFMLLVVPPQATAQAAHAAMAQAIRAGNTTTAGQILIDVQADRENST